jgi:hypothetical protein
MVREMSIMYVSCESDLGHCRMALTCAYSFLSLAVQVTPLVTGIPGSSPSRTLTLCACDGAASPAADPVTRRTP